MDAVLPQEVLQEVFDQVVREVTEQEAGIQLCLKDASPKGELYTVYAVFETGFHSSLSMCAEESMLTRLTQNMMDEEKITHEDLEDFTKEYFNVVCGQIAARLFHATRIASRFGLPVFYSGQYEPQDFQEHFTLKYSSDNNEHVWLIHHTQAADTIIHKSGV